MKRLIILTVLTVTLLISCQDNTVNVVSTGSWLQFADTLFDINNYHCATPAYDARAVPLDCYDWGKVAWSGDNNTAGYHAIQAWMQAVAIDPTAAPDSSGLIIIHYFALVAYDPLTKAKTVVYVNDYDRPLYNIASPIIPSTNEGGLFDRWYQTNNFSPMTNAKIATGHLALWPSLEPTKVSHWWLNTHGKFPFDPTKKYFIVSRLLVGKNVAIQLGADYYKETYSNFPDNKEAWHSNWITDTDGFIVVCFPE